MPAKLREVLEELRDQLAGQEGDSEKAVRMAPKGIQMATNNQPKLVQGRTRTPEGLSGAPPLGLPELLGSHFSTMLVTFCYTILELI